MAIVFELEISARSFLYVSTCTTFPFVLHRSVFFELPGRLGSLWLFISSFFCLIRRPISCDPCRSRLVHSLSLPCIALHTVVSKNSISTRTPVHSGLHRSSLSFFALLLVAMRTDSSPTSKGLSALTQCRPRTSSTAPL
jgi:hypothetical protein